MIRVVHNTVRGGWTLCTYLIDDEFYAKHLAKKKAPAPCSKNATAVPYGTINTPRVSEDPPNLVPFPEPKTGVTYPKPSRKRQQSL